MQPIAAEDVATTVARTAAGAPLNAVIEIAGPDQIGMDDLIRKGLALHGDTREVVTDPEALYFGAHPSHGELVPGPGATIYPTTFEQWAATS
jgi:uncharacterized protein YbjT (DUF2867 family)